MRWFQYGVFCPVLRLHGNRDGHDRTRDIIEPTGGDNELWSFGEQNFELLTELVLLRERLRPYIFSQMTKVSETGIPVMRPMFFDYPDDEICYSLGEQYMFGDDIIFAPVIRQGQTEKNVYLPAGKWIFTQDKSVHEGAGFYTVSAKINEIAAFVKENADIITVF